LERKLRIQENEFVLLGEFAKPWYTSTLMTRKNKLGQLYLCKFREQSCICRVLDFDRITSYQMESCFMSLATLRMLKMQSYIEFPLAIFISESNKIHIIKKETTSLHEALYYKHGLTSDQQKLQVLILLAKIVNTLHG
jgi:hypothetical protein